MRFRNTMMTSLSLIEDLLARVRSYSSPPVVSARPALDIAQLEDRVMLSATPLAPMPDNVVAESDGGMTPDKKASSDVLLAI